jgi:hypothetical protein
MKQRGRKSAAGNVVSIAAFGVRPMPTPSHPLRPEEKFIFDLVGKDNQQIRALDAPLLTAYAIACARLYKIKDASTFERVASVVLQLATRLRLTPQKGLRAETVGRGYAKHDVGPKPWERE